MSETKTTTANTNASCVRERPCMEASVVISNSKNTQHKTINNAENDISKFQKWIAHPKNNDTDETCRLDQHQVVGL